MREFIMTISWEHFLGIMSAIIAIAWYTAGRFSSLEAHMSRVQDDIREIKAMLFQKMQ